MLRMIACWVFVMCLVCLTDSLLHHVCLACACFLQHNTLSMVGEVTYLIFICYQDDSYNSYCLGCCMSTHVFTMVLEEIYLCCVLYDANVHLLLFLQNDQIEKPDMSSEAFLVRVVSL